MTKYVDGTTRKLGPAADRLVHLPKAILAVKKANLGVHIHPNDNPPQKTYLHELGKDKSVIVFTDVRTNRVRGFIYSSHKNAKLKERHEKNIK